MKSDIQRRWSPPSFGSASVDHIKRMVVLHHLMGVAEGWWNDSGLYRFEGDLAEGNIKLDDGTESRFAIAWGSGGVIGLAMHIYAETVAPERWLTGLPQALSPLLDRIAEGPWSAGFWIDQADRHCDAASDSDEPHSPDGRKLLEPFFGTVSDALLSGEERWRRIEAFDLVLELVDRVLQGGGVVSAEEARRLFAHATGTDDETLANRKKLAQVGLVWPG